MICSPNNFVSIHRIKTEEGYKFSQHRLTRSYADIAMRVRSDDRKGRGQREEQQRRAAVCRQTRWYPKKYELDYNALCTRACRVT